MTPRDALEAGADYIGIGRPITAHRNPQEAVAKILQELQLMAVIPSGVENGAAWEGRDMDGKAEG